MSQAMKRKPSTEATAAWIRLMRVQSRVLDAVEQELKKAGFPPLAWYDALLELSRAPTGELRPVELERQMLIPQYSTSRLIDRLVDEGLAARRECKIDKRGQFVEITEAGRELQKRMWSAYSAAIEKHVGSKLSDQDAVKLCGLLDRLLMRRHDLTPSGRGRVGAMIHLSPLASAAALLARFADFPDTVRRVAAPSRRTLHGA
jgi:DNA-binding MarR family transcriptional regulator